MIIDLIKDIATLAVVVASLYFIVGAYLRSRRPAGSEPFGKRRLAVLLVLIFAVFTAKVSEDALSGESGPIDRAILLFIHNTVPSSLTGFFRAVTFTGSSSFLGPLAAVSTLVLVLGRRRFEAILIAVSVISAAFTVFIAKTLVGRDRPTLWDTESYWGSSFPSGHTLVVAAFATAIALCVCRIRPPSRMFALFIAMLWVSFVAISRLVLGVHWPTDVLVAACTGAAIPLTLSIVHDLRRVVE